MSPEHPDARDLEVAAEFCGLVDAPDLMAWLELPEDASSTRALNALKEQRRRLQGMQANPKYAESARFFIRSYKSLQAALRQPLEHVHHARTRREAARLPMLEMLVDSVLADGVVTAEEVAVIRENALAMDVSTGTWQRVLRERADRAGVMLPADLSTAFSPRSSRKIDRASLRGAAGQDWWDARFTGLLLDAIPDDAKRMVDISCGLGWAAHTVLPHRERLEYLGVDTSESQIHRARAALAGSPLLGRVALRRSPPHQLPLVAETVDVVLSVMALRAVPDTSRVLAEARRVLRPGGRVILVEPDGLGQRFYFDGNLTSFDRAFHRLCIAANDRVAGLGTSQTSRPGIALGPELAPRMRAAGLQPRTPALFSIHVTRLEPFEAFAVRLRANLDGMVRAAELPESDPAVQAAHQVLRTLSGRCGTEPGLACHLVPAFVWVGVKGDAERRSPGVEPPG